MKTKEEITKIVTDTLIDKLGVDKSEVAMDANLQNDLGMDSLDAVELIMEFERMFNLRIDDDDIESIITVKGIIDYLIEQHV